MIEILRNNDGIGNCNAMLLLFQNFRFKRFLVFCSNLLPLRFSEVFLFNFTAWKPYFWRSVLQNEASEVKISLFYVCRKRTKIWFSGISALKEASFWPLDDILQVAYGNNASLAEYEMTF